MESTRFAEIHQSLTGLSRCLHRPERPSTGRTGYQARVDEVQRQLVGLQRPDLLRQLGALRHCLTHVDQSSTAWVEVPWTLASIVTAYSA